MSAEVSLENIQEGAVLAADVLDARDNVLLSSGTQLTKAHISLIRRRGNLSRNRIRGVCE